MSKPLMLSLMLVASTSWAADVPGARDLPEVTRPLSSEIVKYKEGVGKAIRFPLDRVERVNNRVTIDTELELDGHVVDITYQLSARMDYHTYLTNLTGELEALGAEMLFQCESRACGSSGLWANSLFQVSHTTLPTGYSTEPAVASADCPQPEGPTHKKRNLKTNGWLVSSA